MDKSDVPFLKIISQEVVSHFNMLGFGMEHWVFGNAYGTGAITQKWNLGTLLTKVTQSVGDPKELGTATRSSNVLGFCGGLGYTGLLARGPRHQRRTQKLTSTRGRLAIQATPSKISIGVSRQAECRGGRKPKTQVRRLLQILENLLDSLPM